MAEAVDHPPHYNAHPSGVEAVEVCEHLSFNIGNALKYVWRARLKGNAVEDLRKAKWYLERELERFTVYEEDDTGVSSCDGDHWKPFARRAALRDEGLLGQFLRELVKMEQPDSRRGIEAMHEVIEEELQGLPL